MILDTNAVSALLGGDPNIEDVLDTADRHHIPVIVVGEYVFGLTSSVGRRRLISVFQKLIGESIVLDADLDTAELYPSFA
jgi:predicted nucleic acid-binding protein